MEIKILISAHCHVVWKLDHTMKKTISWKLQIIYLSRLWSNNPFRPEESTIAIIFHCLFFSIFAQKILAGCHFEFRDLLIDHNKYLIIPVLFCSKWVISNKEVWLEIWGRMHLRTTSSGWLWLSWVHDHIPVIGDILTLATYLLTLSSYSAHSPKLMNTIFYHQQANFSIE